MFKFAVLHNFQFIYIIKTIYIINLKLFYLTSFDIYSFFKSILMNDFMHTYNFFRFKKDIFYRFR